LRLNCYSDNSMERSEKRLIRLIGLFKLCKAALLILVGIAAFKLVNADIVNLLVEWVPKFGLDPFGPRVGRVLIAAASLTPSKFIDIGVGSFIYSALFLTEGLGLWFLKRWAEWLTIVLTCSLIPVEIWEIFRHPNAVKVLVLVINLVLVAYLIHEVRKDPLIKSPPPA
ncbi:MAG: DUF2127 domain-containing protein, partial [Candidatus Acidiferrum sp.]